jgi:hypothetical protein
LWSENSNWMWLRTEEMFKTIDIRALVFNNNYRLMFLVGYDDIAVMTVDKTVVDVIPLPGKQIRFVFFVTL